MMTLLKKESIEPHISVQYLALGIALLITGIIYYPGLSGGFLFDDFFNIVDNPAIHLEQLSFSTLQSAARSSDAGILKRPITMLTFALNGYFGGITPANLKTTNLIIHLINGILVFFLTRLTMQFADDVSKPAKSFWWPFFVAVLWLTAPINLTGVLYAVQRMTSLAALFTFAGLLAYIRLRIGQIAGQSGGGRIASVLILFTLLAALSKENGILLPVLAGCYELTVLRFKTPNRNEKIKLLAIYFLTCFIPAALLLYVLVFQPGILLGGYEIRDFTLTERLLTEARVLWLYLGFIVAPVSSWFGMYHDDISLSNSLLSPSTTLLAVFGLVALLLLALGIRKKQPLIALGILLFLTGHAMESTIFPLEIAHEHRNYFPAYGIILSVVSIMQQFLQTRGFILLTAVSIAFIAVTGVRAKLWGNPLDLVLMEVQHHPLSPRSNYEAARLYTWLINAENQSERKKTYYAEARRLYLKSAELEKSHISGLLGVIWLDSLYHAASDEQIVQLALLRLAEQKITPATAENLHRLHECEMSEQCKISAELLYDLLLAAIGNPKAPQQVRVSLMSEATAQALKLDRAQEALAIAYDAAKYSPENAQLGINYAALLIQAHLYDTAKTELDRISLLQLNADMARQFERQRALLMQLSTRASDAR